MAPAPEPHSEWGRIAVLSLGTAFFLLSILLFVGSFGLYAIGVVGDVGAMRMMSGSIFSAIVGPVMIFIGLM